MKEKMSAKKNHISAVELLRYLRGEGSGKERHRVEREMEKDPFLREAMEGLAQFTAGEAEEDILSLHDRLRKRTTRRKRVLWYSMAAAVASILIIGTLFIQLYDFTPAEPDQRSYLEEAPPGEVPGEIAGEVPAEVTPEDSPEIAKDVPVVHEAEARDRQETETSVVQKKTAQPDQKTETLTVQAPQAQAVKAPEVQEVKAPEVQALQADKARKGRIRAEPQAYEMVVVEAEPATGAEQAGDVRQESGKGPQQLTGIVLASEDRRPITGASVTMEGNEVVSITDPEGRFAIPVSGDSQSMVSARYRGMEPGKFVLSTSETGELILNAPAPDAVRETQPAARVAQERTEPIPPFAIRDPEPSDGYISFYRYIEENGQYPAGEEGPEEALVILRFRVTGNGKIRDVTAESSPGDPYTSEAIRLLREGPQWIPAFDEDGPVEKQVRMRIVIKR